MPFTTDDLVEALSDDNQQKVVEIIKSGDLDQKEMFELLLDFTDDVTGNIADFGLYTGFISMDEYGILLHEDDYGFFDIEVLDINDAREKFEKIDNEYSEFLNNSMEDDMEDDLSYYDE